MIYPAIPHLLEKVDNRYTLVMEIAKRARQITAGSESRVVCTSNKPVTIATLSFTWVGSGKFLGTIKWRFWGPAWKWTGHRRHSFFWKTSIKLSIHPSISLYNLYLSQSYIFVLIPYIH